MVESHPGSKGRILVTSRTIEADSPLFDQLRAAGFDVVVRLQDPAFSEEELIELLDGVDGVIAGTDPYSRSVLASSQLKVISRVGVGYDSIDVEAASEMGIAVTTSVGSNHEAVADHTFGLILSMARHIHTHDRMARARRWDRLIGADVYGQTLGILGMGRIGKGVARRGRGFDMRVVAFDTVWDEAFAERYQVERLPLEGVLREADFLTLHLPSTAETHRLINAERLAMMKSTAYLVNTARGTLVDESALHKALVDGQIAGAGLDVFYDEPPWNSPLLDMDNVVITPHTAGFTYQARAESCRLAVENALLVLQGKRPHFCVNPEVLD